MINITQSPGGTLLSAGNDNIFCVSGNTIDAPNVFEYKYICDIFVNGVLQVTLKSFPDPIYNVGVFNIKNIINSFLGVDYLGATSNVYNQCPNSSCRVGLEFGEEFVSGSTFVQRKNVNDIGTYVFVNSAVATAINIDNGGLGIYFPQNSNVNFLDSKPIEAAIGFLAGMIFPQFADQKRFLYFVNHTIGAGDNSNTGVILTIATFDATGNVIGQYQLFSPYDYTTANDVQAINVGMDALGSSAYVVNSGPATMFGNGEVSYQLFLTGDGGSPAQWNLIQCNIAEDCGRFANASIYVDWLNELGGFSSWLFNKKNETTQTKQVQKYKKIPGQLSGGEFNLLPWDRNQQTYFTVLQDQIIMHSDFLSDADVLYLKSLVSSPTVYIRPVNQLLTAATVEDNSYRINKRVNQKIYSLQLTVNQSFNDYRQQL